MILTDKKFLQFLFVFAAVFLLCYFGALFLTGIAVPGGFYSPFIEKYFNIAAWLRSSLIVTAKSFLSVIGTDAVRIDEYILRVPGGRGIRIVYKCLGFGVMSFWAAYSIATKAPLKKKISWLFGGLFLIWLINVLRISLVLLAANSGRHFPFGWDHHTWFNILAYIAIFVLIYFFERSIKATEYTIKSNGHHQQFENNKHTSKFEELPDLKS